VASWTERFEAAAPGPFTLVFVSSALGIPPFYVVSILAGALQIQFSRFLGAGLCGRLVRFGLLALIPGLAVRWFWA
jgi:membrane protein YqaA with SNARE-associated domain